MPDNQVATMLELHENADITRALKVERSFLDNMLLVYGTKTGAPSPQTSTKKEDKEASTGFSEESMIEIANSIIGKVGLKNHIPISFEYTKNSYFKRTASLANEKLSWFWS